MPRAIATIRVRKAPTIVTTTRSKGSCGLTGLEAVALLAALRLIRRKRSA